MYRHREPDGPRAPGPRTPGGARVTRPCCESPVVRQEADSRNTAQCPQATGRWVTAAGDRTSPRGTPPPHRTRATRAHRAALGHPGHPVPRTPATACPRTDAHRTAPPPGVPCRRAAPAPGRAGVTGGRSLTDPRRRPRRAGPDRRARAAADGHRRRPAPAPPRGSPSPGDPPLSAPCPAGAVVDGPTGPGDRLTPRPVPRPAGHGRTLTAVRTHRDRRTAPHSTPTHPHSTPRRPPRTSRCAPDPPHPRRPHRGALTWST